MNATLSYQPLCQRPLEQPLLLVESELLTVGQIGAQAAQLAARLPVADAYLNLCRNRYPFMLGWLAAVHRQRLSIFPSSPAAGALACAMQGQGRVVVLSDHPLDEAQCEVVGDRFYAVDPLVLDRTEVDQPLPAVAPQTPLLQLFTSGSTGLPQAVTKCWAELISGCHALGQRLRQVVDQPTGLIGTVPAQHMYGFETLLMPLLCYSYYLDTAQPFFAADLLQRMQAHPKPPCIVTTPSHLRVLLEAGIQWPATAQLCSATAPLDKPLALKAERGFGSELLEIYGSTETGALATRRTAATTRWQPLDDIRLRHSGARWQASSKRWQEPQWLHDRLAIDHRGGFELLGRDSDLIKIGGKRGSLAALNRCLLEVEAVNDGAILLLGDGQRQRLVALVACDSAHERAMQQTVQQAFLQEFDSVFMPRRVIRVQQLPRNATGKIPHTELLSLYQHHCKGR